MSDTTSFLEWLRARGGRATLSEILVTRFAAEYRKHKTLLKKRGYNIEVLQDHKEPGRNLYVLTDPFVPPHFESSGQAVFL